MKIESFNSFLDRKARKTRKKLDIVGRVLERNGQNVVFKLEDDDPFIFLNLNNKELSFAGVRIYSIGECLAFRIQKRADTQPYGRAYKFDIENVFEDLVSENGNEKDAGEKTIDYIVKTFEKFSRLSEKSEKELINNRIEDESEESELAVMIRNPNGSIAKAMFI